MDKRYEPLIIEEKWSELWAKNNLGKNNSSQTFSQVIPPPNVTGTLHMGHSFQYSIMDFYARYNHLNDVNTHWQMGTDHAGIATQMVVENNLSRKNIDKNDLGREDFVKKVWEWKEFSENKITGQIPRLLHTYPISFHPLQGMALTIYHQYQRLFLFQPGQLVFHQLFHLYAQL